MTCISDFQKLAFCGSQPRSSKAAIDRKTVEEQAAVAEVVAAMVPVMTVTVLAAWHLQGKLKRKTVGPANKILTDSKAH